MGIKRNLTWLNWMSKPTLTQQVCMGLIIGIMVGVLWPEIGSQMKPLADIFLRMIKMLIAPLIFSTLVVGIAGTGGHKKCGIMGLKTIAYFEMATTIALIIGLLVANFFQPGAGVHLTFDHSQTDALNAIVSNAKTVAHHGFWDTFVNMFPTSVVDAMAKGDTLQLVVFSVFFALAVAAAGEKGKIVLQGLESLSEVMFKFVGYVMSFAPLGVMGAIAATVSANGLGILLICAKLLGSLYFALIIFILVVLVSVCSIIRIPFTKMIQAVKDPFLLAFTTASSESALPKAMQVMERFGVPKGIVSFVMPTGYTFNLDGSTLYLSLAAMFVAQMAGIHLSLQDQIVMMITLMLTSKGMAAVPRASLVILAGTLAAFHLPIEGIGVILGIDHLMDMGRTAVNLLGNCIATAVVARWEGTFDDEKMLAFGTEDEIFEDEEEPILEPQLV